MTVVVGYQPDSGSDAVLDLAATFAASFGTDLAVVVATPGPSFARADAEFAEYARRFGDRAEVEARARLDDRFPTVPVEFHRTSEPTAAKALYRVSTELAPVLLVLGTASADGRLKLGSTTARLLHSSPVPVALAPIGYDASRISGVTVAFSGEPTAVGGVATARDFAARLSVPLRVATFGVAPRGMFPPEVGLRVEETVLAAWREQVTEAQARLASDGVVADDVETVVGTGADWDAALDAVEWPAGAILAIGTTTPGPIKRVFLGSRASRIVASVRVPVVIFPG